MPRRTGVAIAALALVLSAFAGTGLAVGGAPRTSPERLGPPGQWTSFAGSTVKTSRQIATLRTADGTLHVAYVRDEPDSTDSLVHASFDAEGRFLGTQVIASSWDGINGSVQLEPEPGGGLRVVFAGFTGASPPLNGGYLWSSTSDATGAVWSGVGSASGETHAATASGLAAATLGDGTIGYAYAFNSSMYSGLLNASAANFDDGFCCLDNPSLVASGTEAFVAYTANGGTAATTGTFVRQVLPTVGAPSSTVKAPRSSVGAATSGNQQAVPLVTRGPQIWAAYCVGYPSCEYIGLWQYGTTRVVRVPGSAKARQIALNVDAQQRFWVVWTTDAGQVRAVRSAPTGPVFGAVRTLAKPGSSAPGTVGVDAQRTLADLVVASNGRLYHQQVLPGLTLRARPSTWNGDRARTVVFTVTDATVAVRGATVRASGKRCTTSARGTCSITFPASRPKRFSAEATKRAYAPSSVRLRVR